MAGLDVREEFRGEHMVRAANTGVLDLAREVLSPSEIRLKQSVWEWFLQRSAQELERVRI